MKLSELLTDEEKEKIKSSPYHKAIIDINKNMEDLTVNELSDISIILIKTEYGDKTPECILSAESIKILTKRKKQNYERRTF